MRSLKKSQCEILHLVLKRKWYGMIDSGEKQEEYRDETPHWERIYSWWMREGCKPRVVAFQNGYHKPTMWFVVDGIRTSDVSTNPDWGEPNHPHHILFLGERIKVEDDTKLKEKKMNKWTPKIGFKKLRPDAQIPKKAHPGDAGMDVCAVEEITRLFPFKPTLVKTGLSVSIPEGYEIQVRPRSGMALKNGITVWNSPGTIDSGYKGEIGVILLWTPTVYEPDWSDTDNFVIRKGDRIAQIVLAPVTPCEIVEVEDVGSSDRGTGGFGSTGMK